MKLSILTLLAISCASTDNKSEEFEEEFEEEFDLEIPDEDAEKITTVGAALEYINNHAK